MADRSGMLAGGGQAAHPSGSARARRTRKDSTGPRPQIGLFAKRPRPGAVKTRLTPPLSAERASRLYAAFLEDVAAVVRSLRAAEPTLFLVRDPDLDACAALLPDWRHAWQSEGDLGERLQAALDELLARGAPAVIVGSDHPDLPAQRLREALAALEAHDLVLGPTPDGGFYLVGAARPLPDLFRGVRWSSSDTRSDTERRARELGLAVATLAEWADVDTWEDVEALRARLGRRPGAARATRRVLAEESD